MPQDNKAVVAVDMGGSKYIGGVVTTSGDVLYSKRLEWKSYNVDYIVESVLHAIDDAMQNKAGKQIVAIGLTIPGLADPKTGMFIRSSAMGIHNLPIGEIINKKYNLPVFADNDARACALAEYYFGAAKSCNDFMYITVSNGVGAALMLSGKLYYGAFGNAGELGQCIVEEDITCSQSGRIGTLEQHANAKGILKTFEYLSGKKIQGSDLAGAKNIDILARAGDEYAIKTYELEGYYLGKAIADTFNVLNLDRVIIGGGISLGFDLFEKTLIETVKKRIYYHESNDFKVFATPLKYEGALIGAATLALRGINIL